MERHPRAMRDKSRFELSDISGAIQARLRNLGDTGPERR